MKNIVILGAGTAGTMMVNHLNKAIDHSQWTLTIIDQEEHHYYQPGYLFIPFEMYEESDIVRNIEEFIPPEAKLIREKIDRIDSEFEIVYLQNHQKVEYDVLIIATGVQIVPDEIEGMNGPLWQKDIFDFYTFEGACHLREKLREWQGGDLLVHIAEMPIKCPVAPLEFAFLADAFFLSNKMRDNVNITFVTPMSGAFTKPKATEALQHLLDEKSIKVVPDFNIDYVNNESKTIVDYGGNEIHFDLLVTVPTNMGDPMIERSDLGDELNLVPTNKATLQSKAHKNIFVIGDATDIPASKAGSVAHFEAEILTENILRFIDGKSLKAEFDGHANCFIETGHGKALLIDFNYTHEPDLGHYPFPKFGPLELLKETHMNHMGKLAFRWIYWNMLIKGKHIPFIKSKMNEPS